MTVQSRVDRLGDDSGFTLIELLVSIVILVVGVFGLVTSVQTSHKLSDISEHETVASQVADRELNLALAVPYDFVALSTSLPASGAATDDGTRWNSWLTSGILPHPGSSFSCSSASVSNNNPTLPNDEQSTGCIAACPSAGTGCPGIGKLAPVSTVQVPTASGSVRLMKIYRYVTWVNDRSCGSNCPNPASAGYKGDYKRVTIAVLPVVGATATSGVASPQAMEGPKQPVVVSAISAPSTGPSPCGVGGVEC